MSVIAEYALAEIGPQTERSELRSLLAMTREEDPNDELRGAALPKDEYDDTMWFYLEHPRESLFLEHTIHS